MHSIFFVLGSLLVSASTLVAASMPNVIFILADDLGIGDVRCFNKDRKIATPHLDRLTREGMIFTDAVTVRRMLRRSWPICWNKQVADGRITPGLPQRNAVVVQVRKGAKKRVEK